MTDADKLLVRRLFLQIAELPAAARAAALDRACQGNARLRTEVEALLRADAAAGQFMASPTADGVARKAPEGSLSSEQPGSSIGRYKLLEQIGEGGMGTIWMAEQREPVKRRVALKIIKLGMDTKQVIARFEAERQALAMMDHPNIAKVFDAGSTDAGRPYFVMEYIKGIPILEYCDQQKVDTKSRLELFLAVCHAIQHAHQKGVIHRDIKPSNVLVTLHDGVPVCKVIDFGIAKATNSELTTKTLFTEHRQMVGTPAYMSPEQAEMSGLDIDTRSDIYSLGVLLYELLTGTTPFDIEDLLAKGLGEMMRTIREVEPHKPSTRISELGEIGTRTAMERRVDQDKLCSLLRGDLDWIVMKCLEKDRSRRYETANGLAADIRRHLDDEPVTAGAPSASYRLHKFGASSTRPSPSSEKRSGSTARASRPGTLTSQSASRSSRVCCSHRAGTPKPIRSRAKPWTSIAPLGTQASSRA
jgi:serine/threonine protein kinase